MQYDRPYNDEINIGDLFTKLGEYWKYLLRKWWVILIWAFVAGMLLRFYVIWRKEDYVAHSDFAIKGAEGATTSTLSSLASSFGLGITTGAEFTNDFFIGIALSRSLIKETLLQKRTIQLKGQPPKTDYLANFYVQMYPRWAKKKKIKNFRLNQGNIDSLTRFEDSVLNVMYDEITDADVTLEFNDDIDMNQLEVSSVNHDFSFYFADYLINAASDFYINSQIVNEKTTVQIMKKEVDSIKSVLAAKEDLLAKLQDQSAYTVKAQGLLTQGRLLRDIGMLTTEYATSYSQLELAVFDLQNKTPLVDIVDTPKIANIKDKEQVILYMIIGIILGGFLSVVYLSVRKYIRDSVEESKQKKLLIEKYKAEQSQPLIDSDSNKV